MSRRPRLHVVGVAAVALFVASCGSSGGSAGSATTPTTTSGAGTPKLRGTLTVAAASSLTEGFTAIKDAFETSHPGTTVNITFDSSATLVKQIQSGAGVDVFASADTKSMTTLTAGGLIDATPRVLGHNRLEIITKPGNPLHIKTLADLAAVKGVVALCSTDAPCGRFAATILAGAGVTIPDSKVTRGTNAKSTLGAVAQGDAVAGLVYVTDANSAAGTVGAVAIPESQNATSTLPIGVLKATTHAVLANAFVAAVLAPAGQATLRRLGFLAP